jgi:hypothetical protein
MGMTSILRVGFLCSLAVGALAQEATPVPPPASSGNIGLGNVFYSVCKTLKDVVPALCTFEELWKALRFRPAPQNSRGSFAPLRAQA